MLDKFTYFAFPIHPFCHSAGTINSKVVLQHNRVPGSLPKMAAAELYIKCCRIEKALSTAAED